MMATGVKEDWTASSVVEKEESSELEAADGVPVIDEATSKALLKRIDRRVMPVVNFNILSLSVDEGDLCRREHG